MDIDHRKAFRSNGLVDDFVVRGTPTDYREFAQRIRSASSSHVAQRIATSVGISIQILVEPDRADLFTSLQNELNCYVSVEDWDARNLLRVAGNAAALDALAKFLEDLAGRGNGYSYISEYSSELAYSGKSPEWRLHVISE